MRLGAPGHRPGALRRARSALPAGQPKRRFVVPASGDRRERHGRRLRPSVLAFRVAPCQRGRTAIAAAVEWRGAGVQVPRSGWPSAGADLVPARPRPPGLAPGCVRRAVPRHRPQRALVASTPRSLGFYRALGLRVSDRSLNHGPAQARLDGLPGARVRVTGLRPASATGPGLELLGYQPPGRPAGMALSERCRDGLGDARGQPVARHCRRVPCTTPTAIAWSWWIRAPAQPGCRPEARSHG